MTSLLRRVPFRPYWLAGGTFHLGNAMLTTAAAWLVLELTHSAFLAALVQTAAFLPVFVLSLPAGVLADTTDRVRLLKRLHAVYAAAALLLALLALFAALSTPVLLILTFVLGTCGALHAPVWNSVVNDSVERRDLPQAATMAAVAFNMARMAGPALAGWLLVQASAGAVFVLTLLAVAAPNLALRRWPPPPHVAGPLPPERIWGGVVVAMRYARHSPEISAQIVRTVGFGLGTAALWALLPAIAQQRLGLGAAGYGLLMGCLGSGAVAAGLVAGRLRAAVRPDVLTGGCCVVFAAACAIAALVTEKAVVFPALVAAGAASLTCMSSFNAATQVSAPPWMRARAISLHITCSLGSFAVGAAVWGALSPVLGLPATLLLAAVALLANLALAPRFPLRISVEKDIVLAPYGDNLHFKEEPAPDAGPVSVEVVYEVRESEVEAFVEACHRLGALRRRDGASLWRLYRDLDTPTRYVERFIVTSWADYLRQRMRTSVASQELEERVREFQAHGRPVVMRHYIAESRS